MSDELDDVGEPVTIDPKDLSPEALRGVIENFVLREGTDYGHRDIDIEEKVAAVKRQLERGEARIVYDPSTESVTLLVVDK
jgi:uncharacterized protein YheU (UPF0270 family)